MKQILITISLSIFILSCGQNDTKQKELELKERELALKEKEFALKQSDTATNKSVTTTSVITSKLETKADISSPTKNEQIKSTKEKLWDDFWILFTNAVKQKNKKELLKLSDPDNSYDEPIGRSAKDFSEDPQSDNYGWKLINSEIKSGIKQDGKDKKSTKDNSLIFIFKNNNWYWFGIYAD